MNIIKANYEIIDQKYDDLLVDMKKHVEVCGRICYKSEDKITDTSYEKFVNMLINAKHGAMLEHGTVYLKISIPKKAWNRDIIDKYYRNPYSKVNNTFDDYDYHYFITTNYRVLVKNDWLDDLKYQCEPTEYHEKRYTVCFTYHLAVARDVNRHRVQSIGEESTRYCNYSKEKFGSELVIIEPVFFSDDAKRHIKSENAWSLKTMARLVAQGREDEIDDIDMWRFVNMVCELGYKHNTEKYQWTPQQASLMLPLDTKTCSAHTAFISDWCEFFNLRALGTTGAPRPSAKEVAWPLMEEFIQRGYISIDDIDKEKYEDIKNRYPNIEDYIKL